MGWGGKPECRLEIRWPRRKGSPDIGGTSPAWVPGASRRRRGDGRRRIRIEPLRDRPVANGMGARYSWATGNHRERRLSGSVCIWSCG